jgi:Clathrin light chain
MSNFPSIEEFDGGQMTATRVEDENAGNLLDSGESNFLAREQAVLGDDAQFFQSASPAQGEDAFFGGAGQGPSTHLLSPFHSV